MDEKTVAILAEAVRLLVAKARDCETADEALKYSQAAVNTANAARCLQDFAGVK